MRVHLLSAPNVQLTDAYPLDGFGVRTRLFARLLLKLGHEVILYGCGDNETPCHAFVQVLTTDEQRALTGGVPYQNVPFDVNSPLYQNFNKRAAFHVHGLKRPRDIVATICGGAQAFVWEQNPEVTSLEYSIGYLGVGASYRIFQSQVWRHLSHGQRCVDGGRPFDAVIPPWWDVSEFPAETTPGDYVLYCGRVVAVKGLRMACEAAERAGVRLVVIGHGDPSLVTYGEYVGEVSHAERNRLMAGALALLAPTQYIEPFGNISAEAQLCGTPVISTDFGAFVESVEQGRTGFRCVTRGEFAQAIDLAPSLDRRYIRERAVSLYGEDAAALAYEEYFRRLDLIHGEGVESWEPTLNYLSAPREQEQAA